MTAPASSHDDDLRAQLLDATDLLRRVAGSKDLLASLSVEERTALLNAAGDVFCGDADERRLRVKARRKAQRAEKLKTAHTFKTETDDEARRFMFPQNERLKRA